MINFKDKLGQRALERINSEYVVWLTTVSPSGIPQPRLVWFIWDEDSFLIYSKSKAKKLTHIENNPNVSLHFNGTHDGDDIQVFIGIAQIDRNPTPAKLVKAYEEKYRQGILDIGMNDDSFSEEYCVEIRVKPTKLRGI